MTRDSENGTKIKRDREKIRKHDKDKKKRHRNGILQGKDLL